MADGYLSTHANDGLGVIRAALAANAAAKK